MTKEINDLISNAPEDSTFIVMPSTYLNQSRWKSFQDCDRLFGWEYVQNLVPDRPRKHFVVGTAVHKAQVHIHSKKSTPESIVEGVTLAQDFVEKKMKQGIELPHDAAERDELKTMLGKMLPAYYRHWGALGQVWKPLGMELAFCVEVGEGTKVFLVGTIDNLVTLSGALWLVDYKTMSKLDMREFLKYEIDIQLTAYIYGGTKQLSLNARAEGKPPVVIRGAIIDGMVKTTVPQFHREIYTRDMTDLREFELEFCMKAWEIASKEAMVKGNRTAYNLFRDKMYDLGSTDWKVAFPKNTQQCFRYGTCSHRDLCVMDNETRRLSYKNRGEDYVDDAAAARPLRLEKSS